MGVGRRGGRGGRGREGNGAGRIELRGVRGRGGEERGGGGQGLRLRRTRCGVCERCGGRSGGISQQSSILPILCSCSAPLGPSMRACTRQPPRHHPERRGHVYAYCKPNQHSPISLMFSCFFPQQAQADAHAHRTCNKHILINALFSCFFPMQAQADAHARGSLPVIIRNAGGMHMPTANLINTVQ